MLWIGLRNRLWESTVKSTEFFEEAPTCRNIREAIEPGGAYSGGHTKRPVLCRGQAEYYERGTLNFARNVAEPLIISGEVCSSTYTSYMPTKRSA